MNSQYRKKKNKNNDKYHLPKLDKTPSMNPEALKSEILQVVKFLPQEEQKQILSKLDQIQMKSDQQTTNITTNVTNHENSPKQTIGMLLKIMCITMEKYPDYFKKYDLTGRGNEEFVNSVELQERLHRDFNLFLQTPEVDLLMNFFDGNKKGSISYVALLGRAKNSASPIKAKGKVHPYQHQQQQFQQQQQHHQQHQSSSNRGNQPVSKQNTTSSAAVTTSPPIATVAATSSATKAVNEDKNSSLLLKLCNGMANYLRQDDQSVLLRFKHIQQVTSREFRHLMEDFHIQLTNSEFILLESKYRVPSNSRIDVEMFIKDMVVLGKATIQQSQQEQAILRYDEYMSNEGKNDHMRDLLSDSYVEDAYKIIKKKPSNLPLPPLPQQSSPHLLSPIAASQKNVLMSPYQSKLSPAANEELRRVTENDKLMMQTESLIENDGYIDIKKVLFENSEFGREIDDEDEEDDNEEDRYGEGVSEYKDDYYSDDEYERKKANGAVNTLIPNEKTYQQQQNPSQEPTVEPSILMRQPIPSTTQYLYPATAQVIPQAIQQPMFANSPSLQATYQQQQHVMYTMQQVQQQQQQQQGYPQQVYQSYSPPMVVQQQQPPQYANQQMFAQPMVSYSSPPQPQPMQTMEFTPMWSPQQQQQQQQPMYHSSLIDKYQLLSSFPAASPQPIRVQQQQQPAQQYIDNSMQLVQPHHQHHHQHHHQQQHHHHPHHAQHQHQQPPPPNQLLQPSQLQGLLDQILPAIHNSLAASYQSHPHNSSQPDMNSQLLPFALNNSPSYHNLKFVPTNVPTQQLRKPMPLAQHGANSPLGMGEWLPQ